MSAATTADQRPHHRDTPSSTPGGGRFAGTMTLLRLYLRLDRLRISIWAASFAIVFYASVVALRDAFPDQAALQARAQFGDNPVNRVIGGPAFGSDRYTIEVVAANELSMFALICAAIMAITLTIRHTRTEEESGRMETVRALPVGRDAATTAAFLVVSGAGVAIGAGIIIGLVAAQLSASGAVLFGTAIAATVLVFTAITLLCAQITESARGATAIAMGTLGATFLLRAAGDVIQADGSWLSWLSPLAWAQQTRIYADMRWWPLAISVLVGAILLIGSFALSRRRDLGAGLRAANPGPGSASAGLPSPIGMSNRLLRQTATVWMVGIFIFGLIMGSLVDAVADMLEDNTALEGMIAIDTSQLTDSFAAAMLPILMSGPVAQIVGSLLRWREEESSGRISDLLIAGASRTRLLASWIAVAAGYAMASVLALGTGVGLGMATTTGDASWISTIPGAALAYLPAVLAVGALAAALIGWFPTRAGLAYIPVLWVVVVAWLGELLGLAQPLRDLSPVELIPTVPLESFAPGAPFALTGAAAALTALALVGLRRRDILA